MKSRRDHELYLPTTIVRMPLPQMPAREETTRAGAPAVCTASRLGPVLWWKERSLSRVFCWGSLIPDMSRQLPSNMRGESLPHWMLCPVAMNVLSVSAKASLWQITSDTMNAITAEAVPFFVVGREILQCRAPSSSCFLFTMLVCIPSSWKWWWSLGACRMYEGCLTEILACFTLNRFAKFRMVPLSTSNLNITQLRTKSHGCKIHNLLGVGFLPRSMRRAWRSCDSHMEFMDCAQSSTFWSLKTHRENFSFFHPSLHSFN